jgi:2-dehydro-3-deoxygalactonokinase
MQNVAVAAVDWGTSSFRLWLLDQTGMPLAEVRGDQGMAALKPEDYGVVLETALTKTDAPADAPVIICGMAGAAQGWRPAPYFDLPADLSVLHEQACSVDGMGREIRILPGLAQRNPKAPDVMRGEETLLLGATLAQGIQERTVCLPGTHSKWASIIGGNVKSFGTAMTGEIFGLLAKSSTLSHFIDLREEVSQNSSFSSAVAESLDAPEALLRRLFSVRSGPLLFGENVAKEAAARLSGLLIGSEIAAFRAETEDVLLVASGKLANAYAQALGVAGVKFDQIDAEVLTRSGLAYAAGRIWPERFVR